jgi:MFS superfamily sulfate permease-like transporter
VAAVAIQSAATMHPSWRWLPNRGRLTLSEASGALGDLGTFIPLLLGLARQGSVAFVPAVFFAGVFNLGSGLLWDAPMPVQPMKTIAAVGIAEGLSPPQVAAAGMMVSAMVLALGLTRSIVLVGRLVPEAVVLGLQLGLGISLGEKAFALIAGSGPSRPTDDPHLVPGPLDSTIARHVSAVIGVGFALAVRHSGRKVPSALLLFALGAGVGVYTLFAAHAPVSFAPVSPIAWPLASLTRADLEHAFFNAALPQLPLTLLNSVVSVCKLADKLTPEARVTKPAVAISVGLMNLLAGPFGAMPCCHGAGGLAAQHAFGARRGAAVLFLGGAKVASAVAVGGPLLAVLAAFPDSILGVLLLMSGVELARAGAQLGGRGEGEAVVGLLTAAATLKYKSGVGCLVGLGSALINGGLAAAVRRCRERRFVTWLRYGDDASPPLLVQGQIPDSSEGRAEAGVRSAGEGLSEAGPVPVSTEGADASGREGAAGGATHGERDGGERV